MSGNVNYFSVFQFESGHVTLAIAVIYVKIRYAQIKACLNKTYAHIN